MDQHDDFDTLTKERPEWFPKPYMYGCGPGWHKLIRETCDKIAALEPPDFKFVQIKEKFGGLRLYAQGNTGEKTQEIYQILHDAEDASYCICEECGETEGVQNLAGKYGWLKSLCPQCHAARMKD